MTLPLLLAMAPLVAVLVAMLARGWSAGRAGLLGLALAVPTAWWAFGFGTTAFADAGPAGAVLGSALEGCFTAGTILWILFPALCIHELQLRTGALDALRDALARLSGDPRILALLVAWFFALFVEGAAGFGTSVALAAPFLVAAGFGRVEAVAIALIGHSVGVSFGAVGTPILAQAAIAPFRPEELAAATVPYHTIAGALVPLVVLSMATRAMPAAPGTRSSALGWTLLAAALFLVPYHLIATRLGPELATLGASLLGSCAFVLALRLHRRRASGERDAGKEHDRDSAAPGAALGIPRAAAPYLVLVVLVLTTRLIPSVKRALSGFTIDWEWLGFSGSFAPLYHPGSLLLLCFALGAKIQGTKGADGARAVRAAGSRLVPVAVALLCMLALSRVMVHSGMIGVLADGAAGAVGRGWPLVAPFVGALGSFVTGSATASNILFTEFQGSTADRLGLPALAMLGAQGFGAAVGNIVAPHNLIAASATVQLLGREGAVLARTLWVAVLYAGIGGLAALWVFT